HAIYHILLMSMNYVLPSDHLHSHLFDFPTRRTSDLSAFGRPLIPVRVAHVRTRPSNTAPSVAKIALCTQAARSGGMRPLLPIALDRKSTRLNSSHVSISYAVFCSIQKTLLIITVTMS